MKSLNSFLKSSDVIYRELSSTMPGGVKYSIFDQYEIMDAKREAARIIEEAITQGDAILEEARASARSMTEEAREEGRKQGFKEGRLEGLRDSQNEIAQAKNLLEQARAEAAKISEQIGEIRESVIKQAQYQIAELAMEVAEKIIRREVALDSNIVFEIVKDAINRAPEGEETAIVRINPVFSNEISNRLGALLAGSKSLKKIDVIEDANIEPGGCIVETGGGTIDAQIEAQMEKIADAITQLLGEEDRLCSVSMWRQ